MKMFSTRREALDIFENISPELVYTVREEISGNIITGTKMELFHSIIDADREENGNVSHVPASHYYQGEEPSDEYIETWAIIECAYI